jgi:hypothetical protein
LNAIDSDNDSLKDWQELFQYYTNPFLVDTDNDGYNDAEEYISNTDPNNFEN